MGLQSWFRGLFGGAPRPESEFAVSKWRAAPMRRGTPELLEAYKLMPWLHTLVDVTSDGVADLQWKVYRPVKGDRSRRKLAAVRARHLADRREGLRALLDDGEIVEVPDHLMLKLLENPNDQITGRQVAKLEQQHLDLVGETFLVLDLVGKMPVGYWPLPPSAVQNLPDYSKPPSERVYTVRWGGLALDIPADRVLHLRHADPADPMGRGVGKGFTLGDELDTDEYAARFAKNYFYNHGTPAVVLGVEGASSSETPAMKRFKESFAADHQGVDNAGKVLIVGGKVSAQRLDTPFGEMDMNALRKGGRDFVRMNFRVPPEIVGDLTSSNKSTAWAAGDALARNAIVPRAEFLRSEYQLRLMPRLGAEGDALDFESPIPADREHQLRVMSAFPSSFQQNEARELAGMKPDPTLTGYLAPLPGQVEAGPKPADAPQGSEADTAEEQAQPSNKKGAPDDPPWAGGPIV